MAITPIPENSAATPGLWNSRFLEIDSGISAASANSLTLSAVSQRLDNLIVNVKDQYGAAGDGVTNDRTAILNALSALTTVGGGTLFFPPGTYLVSGTDVVSVPVPVSSNYTTANENIAVNLYLAQARGIRMVGSRATIQTTTTGGGIHMLMDGCSDIEIDGLNFQGTTVVDSATGNTSEVGTTCFGFTSSLASSQRIRLTDVNINKMFVGVYTFGSPLITNRVRDMTISNMQHSEGRYSLAFHNNGDQVRFQNLYSSGVGRSYFVFGVDDHEGDLHAKGGAQLPSVLIKAYDRETTNINLRARVQVAMSAGKLNFDSDHSALAQPVPKALRNISVWLDDTGSTGSSVEFFYRPDGTGATLASTATTTIFDNIKLYGKAQGIINSTVVQSPLGRLDADGLVQSNGSPSQTIYAAGGFYPAYSSMVTILGDLLVGSALTSAGRLNAMQITLSASTSTLNLNQARLLSVRTLAASAVTVSGANTNVAPNEIVFTIGGASGASLAIHSGGTVWVFNSALSARAT